MKYEVTLNGKTYEIEVEEGKAVVLDERAAAPAPAPAAPAPAAPAPAAPAAGGDGEPVAAPLPGTVLAIKATAGQAVRAGDVVAVIEAMKMENEIAAPRDGTVSSVSAAVGQTVESGTPILYLK